VGDVILKPGRDKSVRQRHPWVFSGAIEQTKGSPAEGDLVEVYSSNGEWLARGYFNAHSQITVRLLTWDPYETIDAAFWRNRISVAIGARAKLLNDPQTTACRLVNAESDRLPGLIVDRYGAYLVLQSLTLGLEQRKAEVVTALVELTSSQGIRGIYERSDVDVRAKEGLASVTGRLWGQEPPEVVEILEHGRRFLVDVKRGHKTGFYLDQCVNRTRASSYCQDREVLDCFAYTGGFTVAALRGGARSVTVVEASTEALRLAQDNVALNLGTPGAEYVAGDVFQVLRQLREEGRRFDLVILDPPKFAHSQGQVQRATRGYKDINLLGMELLRPEGILVTFSCSGLVSAELFQKVVFGASLDAGREVQILERLTQSPDHPVLLSFPEAEYLKGLVCRVL